MRVNHRNRIDVALIWMIWQMNHALSPGRILSTLQNAGMGAVKAAGSPKATAIKMSVAAANAMNHVGRESLTSAMSMKEVAVNTASNVTDKAFSLTDKAFSFSAKLRGDHGKRTSRMESKIARDGPMLWSILRERLEEVRCRSCAALSGVRVRAAPAYSQSSAALLIAGIGEARVARSAMSMSCIRR